MAICVRSMPGHAVLLGEGAERVDLVDGALVDEARGERLGVDRALLRLERGLELLLRDELSLEQDLAERPLLVAGHGTAGLHS